MLLNDMKNEIIQLTDGGLPFKYFGDEYGYTSDKMSENIATESGLNNQLYKITKINNIQDIKIDELRKLRAEFFRVALVYLKLGRKKVELEILKKISKKRSIRIIILVIFVLFLLG